MSRRLLALLVAPLLALALALPTQAALADPTSTRSGAAATTDAPVSAKRAGKAKDHTWLFGKRLIRWKSCRPLTYRLNNLEAPAGARKTLKKALKKITQASGYRFKYVGKTKQKPSKRSRNPRGTDIVIAWVDKSKTNLIPDDNVLGVGGTFSNGRELYDGRLVLNSPILSQLPDGFGYGNPTGVPGTRGQVIMHELAHVMGLGHARSATQVMYPYITAKRGKWGAGDFRGLRLLGKHRCGGGKHRREVVARGTIESSFLATQMALSTEK